MSEDSDYYAEGHEPLEFMGCPACGQAAIDCHCSGEDGEDGEEELG
ncbi:hypothetical protein LCGC14_0549210 [marine sediment metagenome]|uniref:Uncharacterized protein n=1 Tax=marine sediment metagenome TaxID=412755 RepID=A0A0F9S8Y3_9ZZZZ